MKILATYDLTRSLHATALLTGCSHHTVARHAVCHLGSGPLLVKLSRQSMPMSEHVEKCPAGGFSSRCPKSGTVTYNLEGPPIPHRWAFHVQAGAQNAIKNPWQSGSSWLVGN